VRIAHFLLGRCNPESANGVDKTAFHLSTHQAELGHSVGMFSITDKPPMPIAGVEVHSYKPVVDHSFKVERLNDLLIQRGPWNLPKMLVEDLFAWRPEMVHLHFVHIPQNLQLASAAAARGVPYCVTPNGGLSMAALQRRKLMKGAYFILGEKRYLEEAAFIHAIGPPDLAGLRSIGVVNDVEQIPNGVQIPKDTGDAERFFQKFPQLRNRRVILFVGRLDPEQKGLDVLLDAFRSMDSPHSPALVLVGPDWRGSTHKLRQLVADTPVGERVIWAGPLFGLDKAAAIRAADVFVHTSRWEAGIPFSVLEALAAGKTCLLTPAADPSGLAFASGGAIRTTLDVNDLTSQLEMVARLTPRELLERGAAARRLVSDNFDWHVIARRLVEAYARWTVA
jgi:glycosyltransferase involved in cell wall biosynthesis